MPDLTPYYDSSFSYSPSAQWFGYMTLPGAAPTPSPDRVPSTTERSRSQFSRGSFSSATYGNYGPGTKYVPGHGPLGIPIAINGATVGYNCGALVMPREGVYSTYRLMDKNPTLKLARKLLSARILASSWVTRGIDGDVPIAWVDMIDDMVQPLRYRFLDQAVRYRSFGWRPFELIWDYINGKHWLTRTKPLRNELTTVLQDKGGNFVGLYQPYDKTILRVDAYQAMKVTHDADADDHYGTSCHDAAYEPWVHWQRTRIDQLKLSGKIAGIVAILKFPPGSSLVEGVEKDNSELAKDIIDNLAQNAGIALQAHEWSRSDLQRNPALAELTDWSIDFYDAGNMSSAQEGMITLSEYDDKLMMRAWEVPERAAMESTQAGSRADSQEHGESAMSGVESIDTDLAQQFTAGPVDMALMANVGQEAVGKVKVESSPLAERKRASASAFMKLLMVDPVIRAAAMRAVDTNQLLDIVSLPRKENFELTNEELLKAQAGGAMNSGSSNPTGSPVTTGARSTSVVGRTTGSIAASQKASRQILEALRDRGVQDGIAELYELMQAHELEDSVA